ncbi:unnamed protein product, partial [Tetraodon nigroviridis]
MPTAHCQKHYNVCLDLRDFDIVENRRQDFQGQKMTIFYRDHLGMYPFISREGGKVNGGIPQLGHLSAHLSLAVTQISSLLRPNFTGLAVIDWEEWQPLWEKNLGEKMEYRRLSKRLVRQERPGLSEKAVMSLARGMFEGGARKFMEVTLQAAIRTRPEGLWGFYGFPVCSNKHKRKTDDTYTGRCHTGSRRQNDRLSWLWGRSTALYPSIYLPRGLAGSSRAALMVRYTLLEALRVASVWRHGGTSSGATPVLPYARLAYTHTLAFLSKLLVFKCVAHNPFAAQTDLEHTLGESAALGAAGVVLWGELEFAKSEVCNICQPAVDYIHTVLGPFIRALRADTQLCSLQLCRGNGRCARR